MPHFQFSHFAFDTGRGTLTSPEGRTTLRTTTAQLLERFLTHPGTILSKQELMDFMWQDVAVSEASLYQAINDLRDVLGDDAREPTFVRTVPRRGYAWVYQDVKLVCDDAQGEEAPQPGPSAVPDPVPPRRDSQGAKAGPWPRIAFIMTALALLMVPLVWWSTPSPTPDPAEEASLIPLAVFPVARNAGNPEYQWIELGLMDALATSLASHVRTLPASRTLDLVESLGIQPGLLDPSMSQTIRATWGPMHLLSLRVDISPGVNAAHY